ncbi:hypothetical protein LEP1GSC103_1827 [Leptospira borgpetersenii serovar Javanica str. UI 09931]|uniref:Uncharacterized protein n=3 Tax=Leptospira borgpetersenii TaxID=174 RepID=M3HT20_LEPBO|nr:hypothetical protein C4Q31_13980 [Leptospira borgpetersenii serovar Ceylonica]EKP13542.1 hypothetical protein LEP1GSC128_2472 [Leptospira borgpetersenii str. 200801926]EKQ92937.1 hypothetical protein LEP1GSC101_4090 [Leptospira borgpetersenii str. UI 09149]EMG01216.1 hypothetical protein LEP1GSC123_0691 [Leptospira borgpetersenii str. 200701203]EMN56950.1 hypothetical protein LEP1GSC090_0899 [Leptospira borgpetersenii serovar Javanica str. MK146]ENO65004.1 hypothetical protein LEP1GSC191_22
MRNIGHTSSSKSDSEKPERKVSSSVTKLHSSIKIHFGRMSKAKKLPDSDGFQTVFFVVP